MRCFVCTDAKGVYLQAVLLAFAPDEETARILFDEVLKKADLHQAEPSTAQEIPIRPTARVLWHGDY